MSPISLGCVCVTWCRARALPSTVNPFKHRRWRALPGDLTACAPRHALSFLGYWFPGLLASAFFPKCSSGRRRGYVPAHDAARSAINTCRRPPAFSLIARTACKMAPVSVRRVAAIVFPQSRPLRHPERWGCLLGDKGK